MSFICDICHSEFTLTPVILAKYPGWTPKKCSRCRKARSKPNTREENLTTAEVLKTFTEGPTTGVFTDGSAEPNPGPGGWGAVYVVGDQILSEQHGHETATTNNRMELSALIAACKMVPRDQHAVMYTDSALCVNTITAWAGKWAVNGWKKKGGEIKNLALVQELYGLFHGHPGLEMKWIRAHAGNRWNEYADSLATAYRRETK